jgi:hypothetical protein
MLSLIAAASLASATPVTLQGIGDLRIGMPLAALRRMGARRDGEIEPGSSCAYWHIDGREGLAMMVVDGRLVRIDVQDGLYRTASGAHIGMTEAEVRRIYGPALRVQPHPYTGPDGHYLVYHRRGAREGLIFETSHETHRVESMRVGLWDEVQWIEGCS